jgi:hypothetical protein
MGGNYLLMRLGPATGLPSGAAPAGAGGEGNSGSDSDDAEALPEPHFSEDDVLAALLASDSEDEGFENIEPTAQQRDVPDDIKNKQPGCDGSTCRRRSEKRKFSIEAECDLVELRRILLNVLLLKARHPRCVSPKAHGRHTPVACSNDWQSFGSATYQCAAPAGLAIRVLKMS